MSWKDTQAHRMTISYWSNMAGEEYEDILLDPPISSLGIFNPDISRDLRRNQMRIIAREFLTYFRNRGLALRDDDLYLDDAYNRLVDMLTAGDDKVSAMAELVGEVFTFMDDEDAGRFNPFDVPSPNWRHDRMDAFEDEPPSPRPPSSRPPSPRPGGNTDEGTEEDLFLQELDDIDLDSSDDDLNDESELLEPSSASPDENGEETGAGPESEKSAGSFEESENTGTLMQGASISRRSDKVNFAVFSPQKIEAATSFLLDVWAYLPDQYSDVTEMAKNLGRENNIGLKSGVAIERGTILSVTLDIPGLDIQENIDTLQWDGMPVNCSFIVKAAAGQEIGDYPGKASIRYEGAEIAKVVFVVSIVSSAATDQKAQTGTCIYHSSAFASYASDNQDEVLSRIQGMKKIQPDLDIFVDVLSLRSGENWAEKLAAAVTSKDIFYLFWSRPAADSEWVDREWRMALQHRGIEYIDPVPLEEPYLAPPPKELSSLHFNDAYLAHITSSKLKKRRRERPGKGTEDV